MGRASTSSIRRSSNCESSLCTTDSGTRSEVEEAGAEEDEKNEILASAGLAGCVVAVEVVPEVDGAIVVAAAGGGADEATLWVMGDAIACAPVVIADSAELSMEPEETKWAM